MQEALFEAPIAPVHDPGGKVKLPKPAHWTARAEWGGTNREYRWLLTYTWDAILPELLAALMNPSVATEEVLDPTLAKVGRLAHKWGYGGFSIVNACDYRVTDSKLLASAQQPCSDMNRAAWRIASGRAGKILVGYGKLHKSLQPYADEMVAVLRASGKPLYVMGLNNNGSPKHPLYCLESEDPKEWSI